jgi:hypothetical protein
MSFAGTGRSELATMARLMFHISISLDGFITGPSPRPGEPLGAGGERLHDWMSGITDLRKGHAGGRAGTTGTVVSPSGVTHLSYRVVK